MQLIRVYQNLSWELFFKSEILIIEKDALESFFKFSPKFVLFYPLFINSIEDSCHLD